MARTRAKWERSGQASVGDVLYDLGDRSYPFVAIREGRGCDPGRGRERDRPPLAPAGFSAS
jgi:hypothetical protein